MVLKNGGKYLHYFAASPFPLQGKPTQCSRGSKGVLDIHCLYKKIRIYIFNPCLLPPQPTRHSSPSAQVSILSIAAKTLPTMSGSGAQGKWMASSVTEEHIKELRKAGYLAKEIARRLPAKKQIIPMPKPNERVVFIPQFLRGLGSPLHPFVRELMYYYGLDFHDLAPNSFLNISAFIVVCGPSLRIPPSLRPMAQGIQCEGEGGQGTTRGVRRRHGEQAP